MDNMKINVKQELLEILSPYVDEDPVIKYDPNTGTPIQLSLYHKAPL